MVRVVVDHLQKRPWYHVLIKTCVFRPIYCNFIQHSKRHSSLQRGVSLIKLNICFMFTLQEFWDYAESKKIRKTKAEWSVTSEWSPDGCYFMTATTAPRLQVDNGYVIFGHQWNIILSLCYMLGTCLPIVSELFCWYQTIQTMSILTQATFRGN